MKGNKFQDELKAAAMYWCKFVLQNDAKKYNSWKILESLISRAVDTPDPEYIKQLEAGCEERDKYKKALELACERISIELETPMTDPSGPVNRFEKPEYWIEKAQEGK